MFSWQLINIMLTMGYCVDFTAHMTRTYVSSKGKNRYEKVKDSLGEFGFAILQSAVAAIMAVLCLGSSYSYILRVGFRFFFVGIILSVFHTLFIFPVMLYHLGPNPLRKSEKCRRRRRRRREPAEVDEDHNQIRQIARIIEQEKTNKSKDSSERTRRHRQRMESDNSRIATIAPAAQTFVPNLSKMPQVADFVVVKQPERIHADSLASLGSGTMSTSISAIYEEV